MEERDEAEIDPRLQLARELDRVRRVVDGEMLDAHERVREDPFCRLSAVAALVDAPSMNRSSSDEATAQSVRNRRVEPVDASLPAARSRYQRRALAESESTASVRPHRCAANATATSSRKPSARCRTREGRGRGPLDARGTSVDIALARTA